MIDESMFVGENAIVGDLKDDSPDVLSFKEGLIDTPAMDDSRIDKILELTNMNTSITAKNQSFQLNPNNQSSVVLNKLQGMHLNGHKYSTHEQDDNDEMGALIGTTAQDPFEKRSSTILANSTEIPDHFTRRSPMVVVRGNKQSKKESKEL